MVIRGSLNEETNINQCTFSDNADIGYAAHLELENTNGINLTNNIFSYGRGGVAINCYESLSNNDPIINCCDIYGNSGGDWVGCIAGQLNFNGNFSSNPRFCDRTNGDLTLAGNSPCLPENNSCGVFIGALDYGCNYLCGDVDDNGFVNLLDITHLINYLYRYGPPPSDAQMGDVNSSGSLNLLDVTYLINYLYRGGPEPDCGEETGTVIDIDSNVYQTVLISNQCWMVENPKVTLYRNGDPIPNVTDGDTWSGLFTGAYCEYNNDPDNVATYGRLYNWYAVDDSRNIAPEGWHIPTDAEWKQLEMYLGMSQAEADDIGMRGTDKGGKLKEAGLTHWSSPNTGATNESGFTALPGSGRSGNDEYYALMGFCAFFWSSTGYFDYAAWHRSPHYDLTGVFRSLDDNPDGFSIRCIQDQLT
ncbi:MAG: FISUMP domain-containing protein, partial [Candidatus Zixiibacteriota bacterium]